MAGDLEYMLLTETIFFEPGALEIVESANLNGPLIVRGPFSRYGLVNENGRLYTEELWRNIIESANSKPMEKIRARGMYGHLDHPDSGKTRLAEASHIITKLEFAPNGTIIGEAEILPTAAGKNLRAIIESGCRVGISSRGQGSINRATNVVQNDFVLESFDFVATPSQAGAFPKPISGFQPQKTYALRSEDTTSVKEKVLFEAKRALSQIPSSSLGRIDSNRAASLVRTLLEHETKVGAIQAADAPLSSQAQELLSELKDARAALEQSIVESSFQPANPTFGGSNSMSGVNKTNMSPEARLHILEHETETQNAAIQALQEENERLRAELAATTQISEEVVRLYRGVVDQGQNMAEWIEGAEKVIASQHKEIQKNAQALSEQSGNADTGKELEAAMEIMEELLGHVFQGALFSEELGARYTALAKLCESTLYISKSMVLEGAREQLLNTVAEGAVRDNLAKYLQESVTVEDLQNRYEMFAALVESVSAVPPQAPPVAQSNVQAARQQAPAARNTVSESYSREPLPNPQTLSRVPAQSRQQQQLMESAANHQADPNRLIAGAMHLAARLGEKPRR